MKIKPENKYTLSLKESFRVGIFTDGLGGCLQGHLFLATLPRVLVSPSMVALLAAFAGCAGLNGAIGNTALGPTYF